MDEKQSVAPRFRWPRSEGSSSAPRGSRACATPTRPEPAPLPSQSGLVTCVLAPEQTEGPYYVDDAAVRRNVTEGKPGVPLTLRLTVVNASSCKPIKGAAVEIWHCDAAGVYSGVSRQSTENERFLRGRPANGREGPRRSSSTIYPGWYQGRTVHIHTMVHIGGNVVHTGQLYFPDAVTDAVYRGARTAQRPDGTRATPATASIATAASARR